MHRWTAPLILLMAASLTLPLAAQAAEDGAKTLPPELTSCLKSELGPGVFEEIKSGQRGPTAAEETAGEACFAKFGPPEGIAGPPHGQRPDFSPETASCLEKTLGSDYRSILESSQGKESQRLREQIGNCFGQGPPKGQREDLPPEVKRCVVSAIGQAEFDRMKEGGQPPAPGSESEQKIRSANCFKDFHHGDGPKQDMTPEQEACIKNVLGGKLPHEGGSEPTEAQQIQIGKDCFGHSGPDEGKRMPEPVRQCIESALGDAAEDLKKGPDLMTSAQQEAVGTCFREHNFFPGGEPPKGDHPAGRQLDPEKEACITRLTGWTPGPNSGPPNFTEEQHRQIGTECLGFTDGQGPDGRPPAGQPQLPPDKLACVQGIVADGTEPSDEQKRQIHLVCFGGKDGEERPPTGDVPPHERPGLPPPTQQSFPPDQQACIDRITSGQPATEDQRSKIAQECFGHQASGPPPEAVPDRVSPEKPLFDQPPPDGARPFQQKPPEHQAPQ